MSFEGKIALVTGASRGIGRAIAETLVARGAKVIGTATSENGAQAISEYLGANGKGLVLNVTEPASIESVLGNIRAEFGEVDILVNNAGICRLNKVLRFGRADWDPMIETNLTAAFELSHEAAKIMVPRRCGKIINICSVFSYLGGSWSPAYAATKHALAGLTKAYCEELGPYNIQVNGIAPGYYETDMTAIVRNTPKENRRVLAHIPAGRWGEAQDLMGAVVFLASRASDYVNGHILAVDGGYLVR